MLLNSLTQHADVGQGACRGVAMIVNSEMVDDWEQTAYVYSCYVM